MRLSVSHLDRRLRHPAVRAGIAAVALSLVPLQAAALDRALDGARDQLVADAALAALTDLPADVTEDGATTARLSPAQDPAPARRSTAASSSQERNDPVYEAFAERWPAQAAAGQDPKDPATTRWALLIGINEHSTSVRDNYGSAQDAIDLREFLIAKGWRDDHIVLMTDLDATRDNIVAGMSWLTQKTNADSVAIFHYSGHSKKWYDQDHDGDGEITDEGLWPSDGRFIVDSEMVARLRNVTAGKFWISIGACNAEGFNDPGLAREGRLLTFSSTEAEKSYEDPSVNNSVYGYYLFEEGLKQGFGDTNGDRLLTVEETIAFAAPRAHRRTEGQRYGNQTAVVIDNLAGDFDFEIPPPPPEPEPEPEDEPANDGGDDDGLLCPIICNEEQG